jgi:hypothetical protein
MVAEQWSLLALPVGDPDGPPPSRLDLATNVARIEDGAAVETPARSGGGVPSSASRWIEPRLAPS